MKFKFPIILGLIVLTSCEVGPDYIKPNFIYEDSWKFFNDGNSAPNLKLSPTDDKKVITKWWENFGDKTLNDLIAQTEKENLDLKVATARVKQARANRLNARAELLPEINGTASATREKSRQLPTAVPFNDYEAGFDAVWELDIFGGNRRRAEAADYQYEAVKAAKNDVLVTLRAEVARNYIEARNYQNQIKITEDNIKSQRESFDLTKAQRNAGIVSDLDVNQAGSIFNSTKAHLPALQSAFEISKNNISILIAQQPGKIDELFVERKPVPVAKVDFLISTPARAISERPDVNTAERQLAATTALQGAAIAAQYPDLSLNAMFGYDHNNLRYGPGVAGKPGNVYTLGASTVLPLIDFGRIRSQINLADAENEEAMANYQKTVLAALGEIQNDLVNYANEVKTYEALKAAAASSQKTVDFSRARYESGVSAFTDVLVAQRDSYTAQSQLADSEASVAKDLIALNKALGR